jgi:group I intron endonuclease
MIVYKYTNKINGKIYIGITVQSIEVRHKQHFKDIKKDRVFHRALKKYGEDNFLLEIIDKAGNYEELKEKERFYIKKYNSFTGFKNSNGYNNTYRHTEKNKKIMSELRKEFYKNNIHPSIGIILSSERKEKQSNIMKGRYFGEFNPFYGEKHPEGTRKKMSELAIKRYQEGKHPRTGSKLSEATKRLIGLRHKGKTISKEQRENQSKMFSGEKHPNSLKVICITTNELFNYMGEACTKYNLDRSNLTKCCRGKTRWCGIHPDTLEHLEWRYI